MALPYQTYQDVFGRPWPGGTSTEIKGYLSALGITAPAGSAEANVALQNALLGGWRPGQAAAPAPAPAPTPAPAPAPRPVAAPATPSPTALPVDPGLLAQQWEAMLGMEEYIANQLADIERERLDLQEQRDADTRRIQEAQLALQEQAAAQTRILTEAQLAANPADFVAYELYKRSIQEEGFEPTSDPRSDVEIQDLFSLALGLDEGRAIEGTGRFGVEIPRTQEISRSEFGAFSPTDIDLLSSFLRGGVETGPDTFQGIDPASYLQELGEGFIPTIPTGRTQFRF